jgi:hypothetical protein
MNKKQVLPRWYIALFFLPALFWGLFSAIPMSIVQCLAVTSYFFAVVSVSAIIGSIYVFFRFGRRLIVAFIPFSLAVGVAAISRWEWNLGQAWNLPRAQRLALDMTTLPALGFFCIISASVVMILISRNTIVNSMRKV